MDSSKLQMTVVIIARNEAHNIEACLSTLTRFDEILVLDNGSTDGTIERANAFNNTRVIATPWKGYGPTRQMGVDAAKHDWILWLDADERLTPELESEVILQLNSASTESVFSIPRKNYFLGKHIRGCGWAPDRVLRVFNRKQTRFDTKDVHEGLVSASERRLVKLEQPLTHYSYISIKQFFEKNLRYALLAGEERFKKNRKVSAWELALRPVWEFFRCYILKRGFLDGLHGLAISGGSAVYVFVRDTTCFFLKLAASQK